MAYSTCGRLRRKGLKGATQGHVVWWQSNVEPQIRGKNLAHLGLGFRDGMRLAFDWYVDKLFTFSYLQKHSMGWTKH